MPLDDTTKTGLWACAGLFVVAMMQLRADPEQPPVFEEGRRLAGADSEYAQGAKTLPQSHQARSRRAPFAVPRL